MEWYNWFTLFGGSALLGAIAVDIYIRIKNGGKKAIDKHKDEKLQEEKKLIADVVQEVMAPSCANLAVIKNELTEIKQELKTNKAATVTGLRADLMLLRDRFRDQGFASTNDKAAWMQLYHDYSDLGGNHFKEYVDQWKDEVTNQPITPDPTKDRRKH